MGLATILKKVGGYASLLNPITAPLGAAYGLYSNVRANRAAKLDRQRNSLTGRVGEARAAGIHPLAALGYNAGGTVPGQQSTGSGLSGGVDQIRRKSQPGMNQANLRAINASAARDEAAAAEHWSNVARTTQGMTPARGMAQQADQIPQAMIKVKKDGKTVEVPNPELMEDEVSGNLWAAEKFLDRYKARSKAAAAAERKRIIGFGKNAKGLFSKPKKLPGSKYWRQHGGK